MVDYRTANEVTPRSAAVPPASEARVAGEAQLRVQIWQGLEQFDGLATHWQRLAQRCSTHYLHFPDWYRQKLEQMEDSLAECYFFAYFSGEEPVAVIPLKYESTQVKKLCLTFRLRSWALYYPDEMGVCDATIDPHYRNPQLFKRLIADLKALGRPWDCLALRHISDESHFLPAVRTPSFNGVLKKSHLSKFLDTDQTYDAVMRRYSKKYCRNLRRKQNKLAKMGEVTYRFVREVPEIPAALEKFFEVEASGWKGKIGTAVANQPHKERMYRKLVERLAHTGNAGVHLLELNGHPIAGQLAIYAGSSVYLMKIGYDESCTSVSPGFLLVNELLQRCCEQRHTKRLSFVTGVGWMDVWKPAAETVYCAYCFRWRWLNAVAKVLFRLKSRLGAG